MVQGLQEKAQQAEAAAQRGLSSLKERVEALTEEHLEQEPKQVNQDARIQRLEKQFRQLRKRV
jgi:predicted aminopeptidase